MKRVLFVCMGNICRSPAAEGVFRSLVEQKGLQGQFEPDSAGTIRFHVGEAPDSRMSKAAAQRGYILSGHSRRIASEDFERFDLILAMDRNNLRDILDRFAVRGSQLAAGEKTGLQADADRRGQYRRKVRLFCDFVPGSGVQEVSDPYYGGAQGFERALDLLEQGTEGILEYLQSLEGQSS